MFSWPLPPKVMIHGVLSDRYLSSTFGPRDVTIDGKTVHQAQHGAIDMPADVGTTAMSIGDGTVKNIVMNHPTAGTYLEIDHGNGYWSRYLHLSGLIAKVGDKVKGGQNIALTGGAPGAYGAGASTGPHLHLEIWKGQPYVGGTLIDPVTLITQEAISVAKKGGWIVLLAVVAGGGYLYARKKGALRRFGIRYPKLKALTG
jgi:murein DD-endopeptidase MepM/ murein hydrolase activator NlpD